MSAPFASPRSNVPRGPIQVAGLRPSIQDDFTIFSAMTGNIADKAVAIFGQSMEMQNQRNLNKIEAGALEVQNRARFNAMQSSDPEEAEEIYNQGVLDAHSLIAEVTGGDRDALEGSLKKRELIERANHVDPHRVNLIRSQQAADGRDAHQTNLDLAFTGDELAVEDAVEKSIERMAREVVSQVRTAEQGQLQLSKDIDQIYSVYMDSLSEQRRYQEGVDFLEDDSRSGSMSANQRQLRLRQIREDQSLFNFSNMVVDLEKGAPDLFKHNGLLIDQAHDEKRISDNHWQRLHSTRRSIERAGSSSGRQEKINALYARDKAAAALTGDHPTNTTTVTSPFYDAVTQMHFDDDLNAHNLMNRREDKEDTPRAEYALRWAALTKKIPKDIFDVFITAARVDVDNPAQSISALNGLMAFEASAGGWEFAAMANRASGVGKQAIDFMHAYKAQRFGKSPVTMDKLKIDYTRESGTIIATPFGIVQRKLPEDAYKDAAAAMFPTLDNAAQRVEDQGKLQVQYNEGDLGIKLALDSVNQMLGTSFDEEDVPFDLLTGIRQTAISRLSDRNSATEEDAFFSATFEWIMQRGFQPSDFSGTMKFEQWPVDGEYWQSEVILTTPTGRKIDTGHESYKAETFLQVATRANMLMHGEEAEESTLFQVIEKYKNDTEFTTGHRRVGARSKKEGLDDPRKIDIANIKEDQRIEVSEGYASLSRIVEDWAVLEGIPLDRAWLKLNRVALPGGGGAAGRAWEPIPQGDRITRHGIEGRREGAPPTWTVLARFFDGQPDGLITWLDTAPSGWRIDYDTPEARASRGQIPLQNPILTEFVASTMGNLSDIEQARIIIDEAMANRRDNFHLTHPDTVRWQQDDTGATIIAEKIRGLF